MAERVGSDGNTVAHYFDKQDEARAMLQRMLETVPPEQSDWAKMSPSRRA
jgi:hypothetical protein